MCTSIHAHGLLGSGRLVHVENSKLNGDILSDLMLESQMFQPEVHGYFLIELSHGKHRSVPGKCPWVLKHNLRFWPAWMLTQDINSMFVWKLQQLPLEIWYMGAYRNTTVVCVQLEC